MYDVVDDDDYNNDNDNDDDDDNSYEVIDLSDYQFVRHEFRV
jgi:hypothetical protein